MRSIVSLSGGMDSATVLAEALSHKQNEVIAVSFSYGSKHNFFENAKARSLAKHYQVHHHYIELDEAMRNFKSNLLASGGEIPEGHYADETMKLTVVPARNMIFISFLVGLAESFQADSVWLGIHAGDHHIYPDCRPDFFESMNHTVKLVTEDRVHLEAPFLYADKTKILTRGFQLGVPYQMTRTCYKQQELACGRCGSCRERLEAFENIGRKDPVEYE